MKVLQSVVSGVEGAAQRIEAMLATLPNTEAQVKTSIAAQLRTMREELRHLKSVIPRYAMEYDADAAERWLEGLRVDLSQRQGTALTFAMQMYPPEFFGDDTPKFNAKLKKVLVDWFGESSAEHWRDL